MDDQDHPIPTIENTTDLLFPPESNQDAEKNSPPSPSSSDISGTTLYPESTHSEELDRSANPRQQNRRQGNGNEHPITLKQPTRRGSSARIPSSGTNHEISVTDSPGKHQPYLEHLKSHGPESLNRGGDSSSSKSKTTSPRGTASAFGPTQISEYGQPTGSYHKPGDSSSTSSKKATISQYSRSGFNKPTKAAVQRGYAVYGTLDEGRPLLTPQHAQYSSGLLSRPYSSKASLLHRSHPGNVSKSYLASNDDGDTTDEEVPELISRHNRRLRADRPRKSIAYHQNNHQTPRSSHGEWRLSPHTEEADVPGVGRRTFPWLRKMQQLQPSNAQYQSLSSEDSMDSLSDPKENRDAITDLGERWRVLPTPSYSPITDPGASEHGTETTPPALISTDTTVLAEGQRELRTPSFPPISDPGAREYDTETTPPALIPAYNHQRQIKMPRSSRPYLRGIEYIRDLQASGLPFPPPEEENTQEPGFGDRLAKYPRRNLCEIDESRRGENLVWPKDEGEGSEERKKERWRKRLRARLLKEMLDAQKTLNMDNMQENLLNKNGKGREKASRQESETNFENDPGDTAHQKAVAKPKTFELSFNDGMDTDLRVQALTTYSYSFVTDPGAEPEGGSNIDPDPDSTTVPPSPLSPMMRDSEKAEESEAKDGDGDVEMQGLGDEERRSAESVRSGGKRIRASDPQEGSEDRPEKKRKRKSEDGSGEGEGGSGGSVWGNHVS
ncbi:hypothetical protein IFR05_007750 [Cadophora sp. M221]|nr:hypothetical protein IFR05_007750 [Cadophora sp. M221]